MKGPFNLILCGNFSTISKRIKFLASAEMLALEWVEGSRGRTASIVKQSGDTWQGIAYYANTHEQLTIINYGQ